MALTKAKASNILLTTPAASSNDVTPATTQYVTTAINNLIDGAPATLNTLNEIAAALNDDAALNTTLTNAIAAKLPLAGGTMTGALTINSGTANTSLTTSSSDAANWMTMTDPSGSIFFGNSGANYQLWVGAAKQLEVTSAAATFSGQVIADSGTADDAYSATGFNSESQIKIDVASTQNNYAGIQFSHSGNTEGFIGLVRPSTTVADSDFVIQGYSSNKTAYTEYLRISDEGNLGLGTTTPTHSANYHTLDIRGTNGGQFILGRSSNMDFFIYSDSSSANIGTPHELHFETNSNGGQAPKMIIKSDGKVGIGTGTGTVSGNLQVEGGNAHNNVYITSTANGGTGYDATLHLLGSASNSESKINLGSNNNPDAVSIKSYQNILTLRTNDEDRAYINASGQFFMNSNDGGTGKVTAATTWTGAKFIVRETNGFIDMQSSGDSQTVGYRLGYRENTDLSGYIKYGTGQAQMSIENNYTGSSSQNEYSTIYFKNKNSSNTLYSRMRIGGANGYISTNPIGNAAQTSHQFEVQGGTAGTIFLSNNLAGYTVGQYPTIGTSGGDLHFQASNTYTGYISYNGGFTDVSDEREKENIATISNATSKLKQLRGVTHTWKDNRDDGATHLGLIAQEVKAVVPEVVSEGPTKPDETEPTLGVHYGKLVPLLIETIKELEARIKTLEDK